MAFEEFYQSLYPVLFYQWISLNQATYKKDHIHFEVTHQDQLSKTLLFQMENVYGRITIYNNNIIEEEISNNQSTQFFYLHYAITDFNQACQLFQDFYQSLLQHNQYTPPHIAICCTGGLSTAIFEEEIQEVCDLESFPLHIKSLSLDELYETYQDYDSIYLAPQIAQLQPELIMKFHKPIHCIDATDFATKNFRSIVQTIKNNLEKDKRDQ